MSATKVFKNISGIEFEIRAMTGLESNNLLKENNKSVTEKLSGLMRNCTVRIGSRTDITDDTISALLSADRKKLLAQIGFFSDPSTRNFEFEYKYNNDVSRREISTVEVFDFTDESIFQETPYRIKNEQGEYVPMLCSELSEIQKKRSVKLQDRRDEKGNPVVVEFNLLDGHIEKAGETTNAKSIDYNKTFELRNLREFVSSPEKKGNVALLLSIISLSKVDLKIIEKEIKKCEGVYNTQFDIVNPDNPRLPPFRMDLIAAQGFILPIVQ